MYFSLYTMIRSNHQRFSMKNPFLKAHNIHRKTPVLESLYDKVADLNFTKFIGKHLCWGLFLIKLQAFRPTTLLKNDSNTYIFL